MIQSPQEEPTLGEIQRADGNSSKKSSGLLIAGAVVFVLLVVIGLFLPPISLGQRLSGGNNETAVAATSPAETAQPTSPVIPGEITLTVADNANVNVSGTTLADFVAANASAAMPGEASVQGNVYVLQYEGDAPQGQVSLTIPPGVSAAEALDLLGWDGRQWKFIPSEVDAVSQQIVSVADKLPQAYALVAFAAPASPDLAVSVLPEQTLPVEMLPIVTQVILGKLSLADGGVLDGAAATMPTGAYEQYVNASNTGAIINPAALTAVLSDATTQMNHINALVAAAQAGGFAGVALDYQEVGDNNRDAFTQFVAALADALHQRGLKLAITLAAPQNVGTRWETGGQDWAALGQLADKINLLMPLDPAAYGDGGAAEQILTWAVRQIDRHKLNMLISASAINRLGDSFVELPNDAALSNFGELSFMQGGAEVEPGTAVEVALSGTASPLEWDGASLTYKYSYEDNGQTHNVWLANAASLAHRLNLAKKFNLGGAAVRGLGGVADGPGYAAALNSFVSGGEAPAPASAAIVWTVRDENGSVIASGSGEDLTFAWDGSEAPGVYTINAEFALGDNVASLDEVSVAVAAPVEETVVEEAPPAEETTTTTPVNVGDADAVVKAPSNVRLGPGVNYGLIANGLNAGVQVKLIGRNADSSWLNITMPSGEDGWIFATLVTVNPNVNVASLPVVEVAAPVASAPTNPTNPTSPGTTAPPPVSAPPVAVGNFELGGQTHGFGNPQLMSSAGMNWVKFQQKWGPGANPGDLAGRISNAHASGFKVLLSIPGSPYPTSIDFASYTEYLRGVAALGPDAIEVWNEMNIDFEWPVGQIDPVNYVNNMLAPAYNAIKSANPNVMVISGAPAPTGFDNGTNAWSDSRYMAGMAAAGAARYLDCVGAHFNAGATSPSAVTGHPAGSDHYSWYLMPTLNIYAQLGKPVCFTELGYLSGEDYGGVPARFSWAAGTTVSQHAQWLAEAVSLSANSGKVRMVIIFNVDFNQWGDDPQAGYAMIRKDGSCPACGTLAQVMGR
ncbi:MAG: hypothetical protein IPM39_21015 [Chloroflexi bacterium]|nr:hypothetical protein [Chloroflexota bacterium]